MYVQLRCGKLGKITRLQRETKFSPTTKPQLVVEYGILLTELSMERGGLAPSKKFLGLTAKQTSEEQKDCVKKPEHINILPVKWEILCFFMWSGG